MKNRPLFSRNLTKEQFLDHYWYKTELRSICSQYGLPTTGTKAELQCFIIAFLDRKQISASRSENNKKRLYKHEHDLHLSMRIIEGGFKFNQQARAFFAEALHIKNFSFTKEMAAAVRKAERENNLNMTVEDLLHIYIDSKRKKHSNTLEDSTYQWNNFLKDFHNDQRTSRLHHKLEIASFLWKKVRDQPGKKEYESLLLNKYEKEIIAISSRDNIEISA